MNEHLELLPSERGAPVAPNTPRKLPHSLDMESSLTANHSGAITTNPNRLSTTPKTTYNFRNMELLIQIVIPFNYRV